MSLRRLTIVIFTALAFLALAAYLAIDATVDYVVKQKLEAVENKIGHPVAVARAHVNLPTHIRLDGVRIGSADEPLLTIERVLVTLRDGALWQQKIAPLRVTIKQPTFHVYSDGTWRGLYDVLKALIPAKTKKTGATETGTSQRSLPGVEVLGGRLIDHGGLIQLFDGALTVEDDQVSSSA
ncbi:MAG: hypothetical protein VX624_17805, partial [Pseudomonadota bacterium]|nr:hypothetical protein [Pseudomonadota bacterium]